MGTSMDYGHPSGWVLQENKFDSRFLGKCEAVMCLGNGYMGLRSATEERYAAERRGLFVAGCFNKFDDNEVTELPNAPDLTGIDITVGGTPLNLDQGAVESYNRSLHLNTGELTRTFTWTSPQGCVLEFTFRRVVSLKQLHTIAQKVSIKALGGSAALELETGINGQVSNNGAQHFSEKAKRFYDKKYMQMVQTTTQSAIDFIQTSCAGFALDGEEILPESHILMDRRKIFTRFVISIQEGQTLEMQKISNVYTSRDAEMPTLSLPERQAAALQALRAEAAKGYDVILQESAQAWREKVWDTVPVVIGSSDARDQLALRFAQYHLQIMTPAHDKRMSIAAKGLSGEGYKGHTFWDAEIFVVPYFTFTQPKVARSLEEYRYLSLRGAHNKAAEGGYEGAQYPWEAAWLEDGEVTPKWGAADIVTGKPTPILSGLIEQHITSDIAYCVWQYFSATGDADFMYRCGYEIILDTAKFWSSRLEWDENDGMYHINDVVGPDEYKEHVDDNAFTNYMAHWNIQKAMECYEWLRENEACLWEGLCAKLDLARVYRQWQQQLDKVYLPKPRPEDDVIPQDKTYLTLENIDLAQYKNQKHVGSLFFDYNLEQVNKMQISKQADIMVLFFLLENLFDVQVKRANWNYYEPRTLHDSSLSLSTHSILASDMGDYPMAYSLFKRACSIDMGENMKSSDDGIHSASIGGIWQCAVFGFAGVRVLDGKLRMRPALPKAWDTMEFSLFWQGQHLRILLDKHSIMINNLTGSAEIELEINEKNHKIDKQLSIRY